MKPIPCFDEAFDKSKPYTVFDEGLRVVEVAAIIGSVDKCHELDDQFRPIIRSGGTVTKEKTKAWKSERYLPISSAIERSKLIKLYPELSPGDIYALMIDFFNNYLTGFPYGEPIKDVIFTYLLARGLAKERPSGTFLRGWIHHLIHNRSAHRNLGGRRVKRRSIYLLCVSDHIDPLIHSKSLRNNYRHIDIILSAGDLPFSYYDFIVSTLNKPLLFVFGNHHLKEIDFFSIRRRSPHRLRGVSRKVYLQALRRNLYRREGKKS